MTRKEFIKALLAVGFSKGLVDLIVADYLDREIKEYGFEIVEDLKSDFRFNANLVFYRNHGF